MPENNNKGFYQTPVANSSMNVGPQGSRSSGAGAPQGSDVPMAHNPNGIVPKKLASGAMPLVQDPVQPKVGK